MRASRTAALTLGICLLSSPCAQAGLYNLAEPMKGPQPTPEANAGVEAMWYKGGFRDLLGELSRIALQTPQESEIRKHYLAKRDALLAKDRTSGLTTQEKVNLSAYLIRLRDFDKAIELLTPLAAQERGNFMVLANLATANQLAGQLGRASEYLQQVKDVFPTEWPGLRAEQLKWYREVEKYHLRLVRLRYRESLAASRQRAKKSETLDNLFGTDKDPVRFIGESGQYEPGKIAAREQAKLPEADLAIVQQLLIWIPGPGPGRGDPRLLWLLGELYNAKGDVETAALIFQPLVDSYALDAPELRAHRKIVQAAMPEPVSLSPPRAAANAKAVSGNQPAASAKPPAWLPSVQKIAVVGAVTGLVIVVLVYMQIREVRRRRKLAGGWKTTDGQ